MKFMRTVGVLAISCFCLADSAVTAEEGKIEVFRRKDWVYVASDFGPGTKLNIVVNSQGSNNQINFRATQLLKSEDPIDRLYGNRDYVHYCTDDATPWSINSTYIGANHGFYPIQEATLENHGLKSGMMLKDEKGDLFTVIKVRDQNRVWLISQNYSNDTIWKFRKPQGLTFTSADGGKTLTFTKSVNQQLRPSLRIRSQKYLINGKEPLPENKKLDCDFLDIEEVYDILTPDSLLKIALKYPGEEYAKHMDEGVPLLTNRIRYRFQPYGACVVEHWSTLHRKSRPVNMGFVQAGKLNGAAFDEHLYYVPKSTPFRKFDREFDFSKMFDYRKNLPGALYIGVNYKNLAKPGELPDRFIQTIARKQGPACGLVLGYSPLYGITRPETRLDYTKMALFLWRTNKTYPHAIHSKILEPGKEIYCMAYRQYFNPRQNPQAAACYMHRQGKTDMIYLHYLKPVQRDVFQTPKRLTGKTFRIVEQSDNIRLLTEKKIAAQGIAVSTTGPAYLVLAVE